MKRQSQSGFAVIELVLIVVIVAVIAGVGYYVWNSHKATPTTAATITASSYQSPPVTTQTAPQVTSPSDLNSAMRTLNQTSVSSSNTDSSQLSTQANGF